MNKDLEIKISHRKINFNATLLRALKQMDTIDKKLLLVFRDNQFVNILSVGDIQRAILNNLPLSTEVHKVLRKTTRIAREEDPFEQVKQTMKDFRIECMPVMDKNHNLKEVYFWDDVFPGDIKRKEIKLGLPVVIMAGGKGERLKPLTNVLPKPLIPLGEKTIVEEIMDRFIDVGCEDFFLSVNYKAEMIKHYFSQEQSKAYKIRFFQEEKPLGTAGSLYMIKDNIKTPFFVSNCDIIIDEDYSTILDYHREEKNELTIVSVLKNYPIPYGTIETGKNGQLVKLREKPELTFQINSGMYILEPHLLNKIPENRFFHITDLIEQVRNRDGRIGVFPVSEGSWKDIGTWQQFIDTK